MMDNNAYFNGGMRIEPLHRRWDPDERELASMRCTIEKLRIEHLNKDQIIAMLNADVNRLQRLTEPNLIANLRSELSTKQRVKDEMEDRYMREIADLQQRLSNAIANNGNWFQLQQLQQHNRAVEQQKNDLEARYRDELAHKNVRITQLEVENARLQQQGRVIAGSVATIADFQAELTRTRAELVRIRGW